MQITFEISKFSVGLLLKYLNSNQESTGPRLVGIKFLVRRGGVVVHTPTHSSRKICSLVWKPNATSWPPQSGATTRNAAERDGLPTTPARPVTLGPNEFKVSEPLVYSRKWLCKLNFLPSPNQTRDTFRKLSKITLHPHDAAQQLSMGVGQ